MAATANIIGAAWHSTLIGEAGGMLAAPIGEAGRILNANTKFSQIFYVRCALPIGGVRIAGQIVLAQNKETKE